MQVVDGHQGGFHRRRGRGRDLHGAGAAGAVTDDAGDIANHVVDAVADLLELATQQPGDGRAGAHGGGAGGAEGRQLVLVSLDVDGHQMAHHQRPGQLLVARLEEAGGGDHWHGGGNTLIAGAGVGHGGQHGAIHPCIGSSGREAHRQGHQVIGEQLALHLLGEDLADAQAIALQPLVRQRLIHGGGFADEVDLRQRHLQGKIDDLAQGHGRFGGFGWLDLHAGSVVLLHQHLAILLHQNDAGVIGADHYPGAVTLHLGQHLGVEHVRHILHVHLDGGQQRLGGFHLI